MIIRNRGRKQRIGSLYTPKRAYVAASRETAIAARGLILDHTRKTKERITHPRSALTRTTSLPISPGKRTILLTAYIKGLRLDALCLVSKVRKYGGCQRGKSMENRILVSLLPP